MTGVWRRQHSTYHVEGSFFGNFPEITYRAGKNGKTGSPVAFITMGPFPKEQIGV